MIHEHVADPARALAAQRHTAVAVLHDAVADHDVLGGLCDAPSVAVAPALDRDAIVAGIELALLDEHVARAFRIAAVVVRPVAVDLHAAHGYVLAEHGIEFPHRRIADAHAFDQHVGAAVGLHEHGPEELALAEHAVLHRHVLFAHCDELRARPARLPVPPVSAVRLAVKHTRAGDPDVGLL